MLADLKANVDCVTTVLPYMEQIKNLLLDLKKSKVTEEDESFEVNKKQKNDDNKREGSSDDNEERPRSWVKKVGLPTFEGSDRWIACADKFFEVQCRNL